MLHLTLYHIYTLIIINLYLLQSVYNLSCQFHIDCNDLCLDHYCYYQNTNNTYSFDQCCRGCVDGYYWDNSTYKCILGSCSINSNGVQQYWWYQNNSCVTSCPVWNVFRNEQLQPWVGVNPTGRCQKTCPQGYYSYHIQYSNSLRICVSSCPNGYSNASILGIRFCIYNCSFFVTPVLYRYYNRNECTQCINETGYYKYRYYNERLCIDQCPAYYYKHQLNHQCLSNSTCKQPYYYDFTTLSCIYCSLPGYYNSTSAGSESFTYNCTRICLNNTFMDYQQNKCVSNCTHFAKTKFYYHDFIKKRCSGITQCAPDKTDSNNIKYKYGDNYTLNCEDKCTIGSYGHLTLKICVEQCFGLYPYKNLSSRLCVNTSEPTIVNNQTQNVTINDSQIIKLKSDITKQLTDKITENILKQLIIYVLIIGLVIIALLIVILVIQGYRIYKERFNRNPRYQGPHIQGASQARIQNE